MHSVDVSENVGNLYFVLEYIGVALAATVGGTVAKRMNFDIVGFAFIALISSLAGGLTRDAILNDGPAAALTHPGYLITATCGALVAYFVRLEGELWEKFRFYADVITIGVWAVGGTLKGLEAELSWVPCILLAVITAIGGSLARDIALRRMPGLFTEQKMYVFPAIVASAVMLVCNSFGFVWEGMLASAATAPVLAMVVYFTGDRVAWFRSSRTERPLAFKLADALGVDGSLADGGADLGAERDPVASRVVQALDEASDEQLLQALRVLASTEVRERSEAKA